MNNISENTENRKLTFKDVTSVEGLYKSLQENSPLKEEATIIIKLLSWINSVLKFDPFSDKPIFSDVDSLLMRISEYSNSTDKVIKDNVYHLVEFTSKELDYLLKNLREKILRNHESMPLYSVRETDGKSLQILARRPGKTVKEKLANQPYMIAVKRRFSTDTLENQLLKLFVSKLQNLLFLRKKYLDKVGLLSDDLASDFISKINFWKHSEEAEAIGVWKNNPPNNVLLQDRRYRKVWLGWSMLRNLDGTLSDFSSGIYPQISSYVFWSLANEFSKYENVRIFQRPVIFDSDTSLKFKYKEAFYGAVIVSDSPDILLRCYKENNEIIITLGGRTYTLIFADGQVTLRIGTANDIRSTKIRSTEITEYPAIIVKNLIDSFGTFKVAEKTNVECLYSGNKAAIDLSYTYPIYCDGTSVSKFKNRIMVQTWISKSDKELAYKINNKLSNGIVFKDPDYEIQTHTIKSVLSAKDRGQNSKLKRINASIQLFQSVREELNVDKLVYAVPDIIDDFDVEPIRIGINSAYNASAPVPVSIAICEDTLQQNKFNNLESGDLIIVVDSYIDGVALTPILTDFDKKLKKEAPETEGIQFIRYPSVFSRNKNYIETFKKIPCSDSLRSRLSTFYGIDAVYEGLKESSYYTDDYEHPLLDKSQIAKLIIENADIDLVTGSLGTAVKFTKLHVLSNKKCISLKGISKLPKISTVHTGLSTAKGIYTIDDIESKLTESSLWFDYLPELKIEAVVNGKKELLNLVKNKKIKPQLNVSVSIPIAWNFTLPANKKFYHFPLVQGNGGKNFNYEAFIESNVFPLKESLDCSLELTYTYGAENPYKLAFIPKRNIGEHRLNVQWKIQSDIPIDFDSLPIPPYPQRKTENYYRNYPNKKDNTNRDIVEWFSENIDTLRRLKIYSGCKITDKSSKESRDRKKLFIYEITDAKGNKINYVFYDIKNKVDVEENIKRSGIIFEEKLPERTRPKYYTISDLRKKIRFPMYALFNDGLKISDFNLDFCNKCKAFIEYISNQIERKNVSEWYINECVYIACSMTDELPDNIVSYIQSEDFSKACNFSPSVISRAFHECRFSWQRELLQSLLGKLKEKKDSNTVLFIVSKAIWKNEKFVLSLSMNEIKLLADCSLSCLTELIGNIRKSKEVTMGDLRQIATCLELLLGLLRTRALDDINIKSLFAPNSDLNNKFLEQIKIFEKYCISRKYSLKSFLEIQIDSKSVAPGVPILVSACKIFLLCEDESDSIRITGLELESD